MFDHIPPELKAAGPGVLGALLALIFLREPWPKATALFIGGVVTAQLLGGPIADYFDVEKYVGAVGFLVGLLSMAAAAKAFATIDAFEPAKFWESLRKKFGG